MPYAIRIHEYGGPEKLKWEEVQVGDPGPGQVRVRHTAVGLNFIDTYHRSGLYPMAMPFILGSEGAWDALVESALVTASATGPMAARTAQ